jgi:sterol desaturase/sphingolipid hydroxylase (fatty acid hydroxylase superfamily)
VSTAPTIIVLCATYVGLFLLEHALPLRRPRAALFSRIVVNAGMSATAFAAAAFLVRPAAIETLAFTQNTPFGLMQIAGLTGTAEIVASFMLMDLTFYYWHRANHRLRFLWRIHNVHHIDPDLDVTTGFRFHFVEVALSAGFRMVQLLLIGPSLMAFAVYEVAFQTFTLFHHSNVRLPITLERALNRVLVTPRMHGIHHSRYRDETNSNFGVVFPWWDRLHRTLRLDVPQDAIVVGVPAYSAPEDNRLGHCFALPLLPQRDYWQSVGGSYIERSAGAQGATKNQLLA